MTETYTHTHNNNKFNNNNNNNNDEDDNNNNNNEMKNAWPRRKLLQKKNVQAQYISSNVPCNKSVKLQYTRPFSNLIE